MSLYQDVGLMIKFFLLFSLIFISCSDNRNDEPSDEEYDRQDRFSSTRSSSVRCNDSGGNSEITISKGDDINSNNAGEYRVFGKCERSNERIEISVENKSLEKMCSGRRWDATLDLTSVVQGRETVSISVSSSGASACISVDNRFNCPEEYIPVPRKEGYTERDFCVMKYEASSEHRRNDRYGSSRYDNDRYGRGRYSDRDDDESYFDKAVSRSGNDPWTEISHGEAREKCQNNGIGYSLMTNDDWQTIARHIESEPENWFSGRVVVRTDNILNVGFSLTGTHGSSRRGGSSSRWELEKRSHILPNGEEIWDFSGGVWEFVLDSVSSLGVQSEGNKPIAELSGASKRLFGPQGNYRSLSDRRVRETPGGLGQAKLSTVKNYAARGGGVSERDLGIFSVRVDIDSNRSGASLRNVGFRCVFHP